MSWICGIDYSTHAIDVVYLDEDDLKPPQWVRYELTGPDAWERTRKVRYWTLREDSVLAVGLEQPRGHGAGHLYRVQGAILCQLPQSVLVQPWLPGEWRRRVGLRGSATKHEISVRAGAAAGAYRTSNGDVEMLWTVSERTAWPQDACDAYCIALATRQALEHPQAA